MDDLGRLEKVDLRTVWGREENDFTPWLSEKDNLAILGKALGLELEFEAREKGVGPFRADIICKDADTGDWVLIENQLARTDHTHLGQLLTYAAGLQTVTVVWLAENFRPEHRAALDWMNGITGEGFRFFGLEIELWKIGESLPAPKFNIVSKPNDWSRSLRQDAQTDELTAGRLKQMEYWTEFLGELRKSNSPFSKTERESKPLSFMGFFIGKTGFQVGVSVNGHKKLIRVYFNIPRDDEKRNFSAIEQQREEIEQDFGYALVWEDLVDKRIDRVAYHLEDTDWRNDSDWPRQHEWLARHLNDFHRVFSPRVKDL